MPRVKRGVTAKARHKKIEEEIAQAGLAKNHFRILKLDPVGEAEERHLVMIQKSPQKGRESGKGGSSDLNG